MSTTTRSDRAAAPWRRFARLTPVVAVAVVALLARLVPVLRGGGLSGLGNYDDGVHFAAAVGLVHGRLPYRDFLLLHPPGIVVALAPFAALGTLTGDAQALGVARVCFMALGALNAVLVQRILRPIGRTGALVGAGLYAIFFPAVYIEHSTQLEGLAGCCVLSSLLILTRVARAGRTSGWNMIVAGALLSGSTSIKIWGAVGAAAVLVWAFVVLGRRRGLALLAGFGLGATVICLPFFAAAPVRMWQMVVVDQLGRPHTAVGLGTRARLILGLNAVGVTSHLVIGAAVLVVGLACLLACRSVTGRLFVALLLADVALLLTTPPFFQHYAGLSAAPLTLVVGSATSEVSVLLRATRWTTRRSTSLAAVALITLGAVGAVPTLSSTYGRAFPAAALETAIRAAPGCVTADDPTALIELGVLSRNLRRGCPLMIDLGGYSYHLQPAGGAFVTRRANRSWQQLAVRYLRSGSATIVLRFSRGFGFDPTSAAAVRSWPVLTHARPFTVRSPR